MDLALKFNKAGVRLYHMGRFEDAFEVFGGGMQAMLHSCGGKTKDELDSFSRQLLLVDPSVQRAFDKASELLEASSAVHCGRNNRLFDDRLNDSIQTEKQEASLLRSKLARSFPLDPFIFSKVASMDELVKLQCSKSIKYAIAMSTTFYNQALLLHLGRVPSSRKCLERALIFYSMAGNALLQNCPQNFIASNKVTSQLYSGILNNKGILLHQTGDFDASRFCFAYLDRFIGELAPPCTEAESRERKDFVLNCLLINQSLHSAPAA